MTRTEIKALDNEVVTMEQLEAIGYKQIKR